MKNIEVKVEKKEKNNKIIGYEIIIKINGIVIKKTIKNTNDIYNECKKIFSELSSYFSFSTDTIKEFETLGTDFSGKIKDLHDSLLALKTKFSQEEILNKLTNDIIDKLEKIIVK